MTYSLIRLNEPTILYQIANVVLYFSYISTPLVAVVFKYNKLHRYRATEVCLVLTLLCFCFCVTKVFIIFSRRGVHVLVMTRFHISIKEFYILTQFSPFTFYRFPYFSGVPDQQLAYSKDFYLDYIKFDLPKWINTRADISQVCGSWSSKRYISEIVIQKIFLCQKSRKISERWK